MRVSVRWHSLPTEIVESASLKVFQNCLDMLLGNWRYMALLEQERLGKMNSRGAFQPQPFLGYVILKIQLLYSK